MVNINEEISMYIKHCDLNTIMLRLIRDNYLIPNCDICDESHLCTYDCESTFLSDSGRYNGCESCNGSDSDSESCNGSPIIPLEIDNLFILSAEHGYLDKARFFVKYGADIHARNEFALRWSAANGHLEVVKYLVSLGVDIHVQEEYALRWSVLNGHLEVVKYLVSQGADIHVKDEYALQMSARNGHLEIVKYLVSLGANVKNAIEDCNYEDTRKVLQTYLTKEIYKGEINETT